MRINSVNTRLRYILLITILSLTGSIACAQAKAGKQTREFCSNNNWSNGDKVSFRELRESTLPAGNLLTVDGKRNGGIRVKGSDRSDVLVRACVQAWGNSDADARAVARNIRIETSQTVRAENAADESNWSVSYEILVPRSTNLKLSTQNGGISIDAVEGKLDFEAHNGGVHLSELAGDVRGRTTNGGVHVALSGNRWKGSGLNVETSNGGVNLIVPESYAARIETGTVNGGFVSEINGLNVERDDRQNGWSRNRRINADLNGGGAPIRVVTTNGGVKISSAGKIQ
jgi:hypothetical protein